MFLYICLCIVSVYGSLHCSVSAYCICVSVRACVCVARAVFYRLSYHLLLYPLLCSHILSSPLLSSPLFLICYYYMCGIVGYSSGTSSVLLHILLHLFILFIPVCVLILLVHNFRRPFFFKLQGVAASLLSLSFLFLF